MNIHVSSIRKICDRRIIVLIVILVVMFILAVISVTVGVVMFNRNLVAFNASKEEPSGLNGSNNNSNGSNSIGAVLFRLLTFFTLGFDLFSGSISSSSSTIYDVGRGGVSNDPPCTSHTVINDPSRSINQYGSGATCDAGPFFNTSLGGRWIRFVGSGGTTIPMSKLGMSRCSSFLAGWYNGTMPTVDGTIESGLICFDTIAGSCGAVVEMSVAKCSSFFVYFLRPVELCNSRYCTT